MSRPLFSSGTPLSGVSVSARSPVRREGGSEGGRERERERVGMAAQPPVLAPRLLPPPVHGSSTSGLTAEEPPRDREAGDRDFKHGVSKALCSILRYTAADSVNKRSDGFAPLLEVWAKIDHCSYIEQVVDVVQNSRRKRDGTLRFELAMDVDGLDAHRVWIRATSGHSAGEVDEDLVRQPPCNPRPDTYPQWLRNIVY